MAIDKAIDSTQLNTNLTSIADAIREKAGLTDSFVFPEGFVQAIAGIEAGANPTTTCEAFQTILENHTSKNIARLPAAFDNYAWASSYGAESTDLTCSIEAEAGDVIIGFMSFRSTTPPTVNGDGWDVIAETTESAHTGQINVKVVKFTASENGTVELFATQSVSNGRFYMSLINIKDAEVIDAECQASTLTMKKANTHTVSVKKGSAIVCSTSFYCVRADTTYTPSNDVYYEKIHDLQVWSDAENSLGLLRAEFFPLVQYQNDKQIIYEYQKDSEGTPTNTIVSCVIYIEPKTTTRVVMSNGSTLVYDSALSV